MKKVIFFLIIFTIPASIPLLMSGGYEPHDIHHIADIYQMHQAFASGQFPPRLAPDFLYGFGYPLFNYYYLLPFYIGAYIFAISGSLMFSFKMVFFISSALSVVGMYLFMRKFVSTSASFAASILYLYTPYRAVDLYVRGAIGESFAISLFPWVLYVLTIVIKDPKSLRKIAIASIVIALFFISHNYFFLLVTPWLAAFVLVLLIKEKVRAVKSLLIVFLLSVGVSAYWWLPAVLEVDLVSSVTPFAIMDHFPFVKQLIFSSWGYGSSHWGPNDEISFQIGIVNLFVVLCSVLVLARNKFKVNNHIQALVILGLMGFFASVFLMNIRSMFIWNFIPFTNFIQFPWRFLALTTFFTSMLVGLFIEQFKFKKILSALIVMSSILLTFSYFQPSGFFNKTNNDYLSRFFAVKRIGPDAEEITLDYAGYSEDYLQLPNNTQSKPSSYVKEKLTSDDNSIITRIDEVSPISWSATVESTSISEISATVFNFPGWFVKVDGQEIETYPSGKSGQLAFQLDPGTHEVELFWAETDLRLVADLISLASLVLILFLYFKQNSAERAKI